MAQIATMKGPRELCFEKYNNFEFTPDKQYCPPFFDSFLCWQPTPAGETVYQNCPVARLSDPAQKAFRICGEAGRWLDRRLNETTSAGWTNYTPCFPEEVRNLFEKVSEDEFAQTKFSIARNTRYLEIVGFTVSLIALLISLCIFRRYSTLFRTLKNDRTRIHASLFTAMVLQVIIRLIVYLDQELIRNKLTDEIITGQSGLYGISNMPYLCEVSYVLLEYCITVMFMWMFIEGMYLTNLITAGVFKRKISYSMYFIIGWGIPLIITAIWAGITGFHYGTGHVKRCWYGYNFHPIYWIVQGPRLAVIIVNFIFLLNILRVLVMKLQTSEQNEVVRVRKALKAALVLLPLLGITNALDMTSAPLDGSVLRFAVWCYSSHFLRSFQGFFIALLYCFTNGEVQTVIKRRHENYLHGIELIRHTRAILKSNGTPDPDAVPFPLISYRDKEVQTNNEQFNASEVSRKKRHSVSRISMPVVATGRRSFGTVTEDLPTTSTSDVLKITTVATIEHHGPE